MLRSLRDLPACPHFSGQAGLGATPWATPPFPSEIRRGIGLRVPHPLPASGSLPAVTGGDALIPAGTLLRTDGTTRVPVLVEYRADPAPASSAPSPRPRRALPHASLTVRSRDLLAFRSWTPTRLSTPSFTGLRQLLLSPSSSAYRHGEPDHHSRSPRRRPPHTGTTERLQNVEHLRAHRAAGSGTASRTRGAANGTYSTFERLPGAPPSGRPPPRRARVGLPRRSLRVIRPGSGAPPTSIAGAVGSPGPSAALARLPRGMQPRRGDCRGRSRTHISQTPLSCVLMFVPLTRDRSRNRLAPLRFGRILPNWRLRFWAESGAGSDPPSIVRSTAPESELMFGLTSVVRGRSQPAPAARWIPAGRLRTRLCGGWRLAAGWRSRSIPWVSEKRGSRRAFPFLAPSASVGAVPARTSKPHGG